MTYTGTVTAASPGSGTVTTGTVTFYDGATAICTAVAVNGSGHATCAVAYSAIGSHTITAQYNGSTNFTASAASSAVTQVVNAAATTTAVVSSTGSPSVVGQSVTYTATVSVTSPGSGPASTGNIEFFDGGTAIASCNGAAGVTVNGSGQAICVVRLTARPPRTPSPPSTSA